MKMDWRYELNVPIVYTGGTVKMLCLIYFSIKLDQCAELHAFLGRAAIDGQKFQVGRSWKAEASNFWKKIQLDHFSKKT